MRHIEDAARDHDRAVDEHTNRRPLIWRTFWRGESQREEVLLRSIKIPQDDPRGGTGPSDRGRLVAPGFGGIDARIREPGARPAKVSGRTGERTRHAPPDRHDEDRRANKTKDNAGQNCVAEVGPLHHVFAIHRGAVGGRSDTSATFMALIISQMSVRRAAR
jgi:hypothetical protein